MHIRDTARFFDRDPISDGYTGAFLFKGQAASFNEAKSDGATSRRRILSIAADLVIPSRRVLSMYGERWVVGTGTTDGFLGTLMRQQFTMKRVTDLMAILTPSAALAAAAGTSAYVQKQYFKDTINQLTDAEYDTQWHVFVAPGEPVAKGNFFRDPNGLLYRIRGIYLPLEGLLLCETDQLEADAKTTATFAGATFDPVNDAFTGAAATVPAIKVEPSKFYRFLHRSDDLLQAGDLEVYLPSSQVVKPSTTFTMDGGTWRVLDVLPELDAQVAHVRRA